MYQFVITILLTFPFKSTSQSCLQPATSGQDIEVNADGGPRLPNNTQAIITSYRFVDCCGDITEWEAAVQPNGGSYQDGGYTIHFQVWRPSPTVESDGCYSLVGENRFTSITFSNDILSATPEATNRISFRPNDVIGFLSITNLNNQNAGITFDRNLDRETVWYHTGDLDPLVAGGPACPYPVGPTRTLTSSTNQGPAISISYETSSCTALSPSTTEDTTTTTTPTEAPLQPPPTTDPSVQPTPPLVLVSINTHNTIVDIIGLKPTAVNSPPAMPVSPQTSGHVIGVIVAVCALAVFVVVATTAAIVIIHKKAAGKRKAEQRLDEFELSYNANYMAAECVMPSIDYEEVVTNGVNGVMKNNKATKLKASGKSTEKKRAARLVHSVDAQELTYNGVYGGVVRSISASASESCLPETAIGPSIKATAKKQPKLNRSTGRLELVPNEAYASTSTIASSNGSHEVTTSVTNGSDNVHIKTDRSKALGERHSKSMERLDLPPSWNKPFSLRHSVSADNLELTSNAAYSSNISIAISDVDRSVDRQELPPSWSKPFGLRLSVSADNVNLTSNAAYSSNISIATSDAEGSDHAYEEILTPSGSKIHGKKHAKSGKNVDRSPARSKVKGKKSSRGVKRLELPPAKLGQQHSKSMELLPARLELTYNALYNSSTRIVISDSEGYCCGEADYHAYEEIQTPKKEKFWERTL